MNVGLDLLPSSASLLARLRGARVGLLAHPASVDRSMRHAADVLEQLGILPRVYFGPEHGYGGEAQDMVGVADLRHPTTQAPIVSLYGDTFDSLSPSPGHLALIDTLVIDLADVGSRYYTFVWTALLALRAAARAGVHVVLLDRPNPLGDAVEGKANELRSFVGLESVPVRHGLSVGELVALFAARDGLALGEDGALSLLATTATGDGWGWDRPFVQTSPNMPTLDTALVYPGGCLIEGTNLSEGRGATRPFEVVGAPWLDGKRLAEKLQNSGLPGFIARPLTFRPTFHKFGGAICGGVQIHPTDRSTFLPYATYLALVGFALQQHPDRFVFRTERYEFIDDIPAFDLLTGSAEARLALLAGASPVEVARSLSKVDVDLRAEARQHAGKAAAWGTQAGRVTP